MAKFWNIDTFIDHEMVYQKRTLKKKPVVDFVQERALNLGFMANNGNELQKGNFDQHIKTFLEAYVDPRVEAYTRTVGVHEAIEISKFLRVLGPQKIQCTLNLDDTAISFVFNTTSDTRKIHTSHLWKRRGLHREFGCGPQLAGETLGFKPRKDPSVPVQE